MPPKVARVLGPYRDGEKWRLVVKEQAGRQSILADSFEEAERLKANFVRMFSERSLMKVGDALDEWLASKREAGIKPLSIDTVERRLRPFLPLEDTLVAITPQRAAALYQAEARREGRYGVLRASTHHKTLIFAKGFFAWAVEREYIKENPFARVKAIGKANAGKTQLREDEARKLFNLGLELAQSGNDGALIVVVQLLFGLRSGEVLGLRARDLDAGGTVLVIEGTKTKNARRRLKISCEPVRQLLVTRCAGLGPDALIFPGIKGGKRLAASLYLTLRRLCLRAGVPVVCPHSLRGLHSSLAVAHGESSRAVAQALGHGSDAITRKHYIAPEALDAARVERVAGALTVSRPGAPDVEAVTSFLSELSPAQLKALLATVAKRRRKS